MNYRITRHIFSMIDDSVKELVQRYFVPAPKRRKTLLIDIVNHPTKYTSVMIEDAGKK